VSESHLAARGVLTAEEDCRAGARHWAARPGRDGAASRTGRTGGRRGSVHRRPLRSRHAPAGEPPVCR